MYGTTYGAARSEQSGPKTLNVAHFRMTILDTLGLFQGVREGGPPQLQPGFRQERSEAVGTARLLHLVSCLSRSGKCCPRRLNVKL